MKLLTLLLLLFAISLCSCQHTGNEDGFDIKTFSTFPSGIIKDRNLLYKAIIPDSSYDYWEVRFYGMAELSQGDSSGTILVYKGDSLKWGKQAKQYQCNIGTGFFAECMPAFFCYTTINTIKDGKARSICDEQELYTFIGQVDNIEEAVLIAKINDLSVDMTDKQGGAYHKTNDGYLLYLMEYSMSPVSKKSVKATLSRNGDLKILDKKVYYEDSDLYINY